MCIWYLKIHLYTFYNSVSIFERKKLPNDAEDTAYIIHLFPPFKYALTYYMYDPSAHRYHLSKL